MKIDAKETDAAFEIRADVPGVNSENVRLHFEDHILKIEASRDGEHKEKGDNYYLQERNWGKQSRSIRFREGIKEDEITAKLENGVLLVTVPKEKPRKAVEIKVK
jgi:HSP20 family protein